MKIFVVFICSVFLIACSALPLLSFHVDDYKDVPPIHLKAADFRIESNVMHYDTPPHVTHKMPITPEQALKNWGNNRFLAVDPLSKVTVVLVIDEASMIRRRRSSGNWYTFDNVEYTLTFDVTLLFINQSGKQLYRLNVGGHEMKAVPRKSAPITKERAWLDMMNAMIRKINDQLIKDLPPAYLSVE